MNYSKSLRVELNSIDDIFENRSNETLSQLKETKIEKKDETQFVEK